MCVENHDTDFVRNNLKMGTSCIKMLKCSEKSLNEENVDELLIDTAVQENCELEVR